MLPEEVCLKIMPKSCGSQAAPVVAAHKSQGRRALKLLLSITACKNKTALIITRASAEWVCTRGRGAAAANKAATRRLSFFNAKRASRARAGNSSAQPNRVARWGTSISAMGFTQRMFSCT